MTDSHSVTQSVTAIDSKSAKVLRNRRKRMVGHSRPERGALPDHP
jgi:hypothetical protein